MKQTIDQILKDNTVMVVDGSMSSALEALGCNLSNKLWTATVLIENPELVKEVHKYYFRAGANCGITCSYQASIPGLMAVGYSEKEAEDYIRLSVKLFLEARDEWWETEGKKANCTYPICLASVGPYGAYLADGSIRGIIMSAMKSFIIFISVAWNCFLKQELKYFFVRPILLCQKHLLKRKSVKSLM